MRRLHPVTPTTSLQNSSYPKMLSALAQSFSHVRASVSVRRILLPAKSSSRPCTFLLFCSFELQSLAARGAVLVRAFWIVITDR
jgi:hypothetical protein